MVPAADPFEAAVVFPLLFSLESLVFRACRDLSSFPNFFYLGDSQVRHILASFLSWYSRFLWCLSRKWLVMSFILALGALSYVCVGRKGKRWMADRKKGFSVEGIPALVHWHKLNCTQPVLSCVLPSCQCTESVQENDLHFPIFNYFVAMGGKSYSAFLAQVMTS